MGLQSTTTSPPWKAGKAAHSLTCSAWCKFVYEANKCLRNSNLLSWCVSLLALRPPAFRSGRGPVALGSVDSPEDLFHWHVVVARGSLETCRDWSECPGLRICLLPEGGNRACRWKRLPDTAIHLQVPSNIASNSKSTMDDKHMLLVKMFRGCPVILIHWFTEG